MCTYSISSAFLPDRLTTYPAKLYRIAFSLMIAASVLAACGGDNGGSVSETENNLNSNGAVVQRFGTRTVRDLNPQSDAQTQSQVVEGFNNLSLQLLREHSDAASGANTINSGFSLAIAAAMLQRGTANGDFNFLQQLLGVSAIDEDALYSAINAIELDLESRSNVGLDLRSANQLFVKPGFNLETGFMDVMTAQFDAPISDAQFETEPEAVRDAINEWAAENTNDLIPELLSSPLATNTILALLNATLLDAKWQDEFTDFSNLEFTAVDGSVQSVEGFSGDHNFQFLETDDALSVSLPYQGSQVSLMIIQPDDIETYSANLTADTVSQRHADAASTYLALRVPNWSTESTINFTSLPMTRDLTGRPLDMTRMSPDPSCCELSEFKQQAIIEVDKDGTRAAAVTIIGVGTTSVQRTPRVININQPFLFLIRDEPTGLILFSGRVLAL